MTLENMTFSWQDYTVFAASLLLSAIIGVVIWFIDRKKKTAEDILMGGRQLNWFVVGLSLMASLMNAIFIIGGPAEIYFFGTTFAYIFIGYGAACIFNGFVIAPVFNKLKYVSAYQYFEQRFQHYSVRIAASLTFTLSMMLFLGVVLYVPALALSQVTGISMVVTVIVTGVVVTFYTTLGGLKAVVWTDAVQVLIMLSGLVVLTVMGANKAGGGAEVWRIAKETGRINFNAFDPHPHIRHSFWTQTIGVAFIYTSVLGVNQMTLQRMMAMKSVKHVKLALGTVAIGVAVFISLITMLGLTMYAYYSKCHPGFLPPGMGPAKPDQLVPYFLMEILGKYKGLPGLYVASIFAAALSSVSSAINSMAAVALEDYIRPLFKHYKNRDMSLNAGVWTARGLAILFGGMTIGLSFLASLLGDRVIELPGVIWGAVDGPLFGILLMGIFCPMVNAFGAVTSLILTLIISLWFNIGGTFYRQKPPPLKLGITCENLTLPARVPFEPVPLQDFYDVSYAWSGLIAIVIAVVVGVFISAITPCFNKGRTVHRSLVIGCGRHSCGGVDVVDKTDGEDLEFDTWDGKANDANGVANPGFEENKL